MYYTLINLIDALEATGNVTTEEAWNAKYTINEYATQLGLDNYVYMVQILSGVLVRRITKQDKGVNEITDQFFNLSNLVNHAVKTSKERIANAKKAA